MHFKPISRRNFRTAVQPEAKIILPIMSIPEQNSGELSSDPWNDLWYICAVFLSKNATHAVAFFMVGFSVFLGKAMHKLIKNILASLALVNLVLLSGCGGGATSTSVPATGQQGATSPSTVTVQQGAVPPSRLSLVTPK
jgi:hypothetical protein